MGWKLTFHFKDFPKVIMYGFVTANSKHTAIDKFKSDYPNLAECVVTEIVPYEGE